MYWCMGQGLGLGPLVRIGKYLTGLKMMMKGRMRVSLGHWMRLMSVWRMVVGGDIVSMPGGGGRVHGSRRGVTKGCGGVAEDRGRLAKCRVWRNGCWKWRRWWRWSSRCQNTPG